MSKSKRNTVDPEPILAKYGADAVRWFMLSDSPPERDLEWSEGGIEGAARFVQRVWRLASGRPAGDGEDQALERKLHRTIAAVGEAIEGLQFNKAVAAALRADQRDREGQAVGDPRRGGPHPGAADRADGAAPRRGSLGALGEPGMIADAAWPSFDPALLVDDEVTLAVQVNGKLRDTLTAPRGLDRAAAEALALASDKVQRSSPARRRAR
jgi:leucyl-tRNA synthetase